MCLLEVESNENGLTSLFRPPVCETEASLASEHVISNINLTISKIKTSGVEAIKKVVKEEAKEEVNEGEIGDPRKYQLALFEECKKKNTIVYLGTGKGKTFVAILCIRNAQSAFAEKKQTWFIVPSVALAVQQSQTLRSNLPFKIETACSYVTYSEKAREKLASADVLVATHGSALDLLKHYNDMFNLSRVNLMILDECHNATKNHPYVSIMRCFYDKIPRENRPRIVASIIIPLLTQSLPINDRFNSFSFDKFTS